jgi:heptosyltransferase-3
LRLLIIRSGALGDTLMLMPSIAYLNRRADILIAGRSPGIEYLRPYVKECIDMERGAWYKIFMEKFNDINRISILKPVPNHIVAFMNDPNGVVYSNLMSLFSKSSIDIFPPFPHEGAKIHTALYIARSLESAGLPINSSAAFNESLKRPLFAETNFSAKGWAMVFHPGSGSEKKNYPKEFWLEMIKYLKQVRDDMSMDHIVLLGPAEEDLLPFFKNASKETRIKTVFCPEGQDLMSILRQAILYIGHDSGITHLSAMTGAPVIALYRGPVHQWAPLGPNIRIIYGEKEKHEILKEKIIQAMKSLINDPPDS